MNPWHRWVHTPRATLLRRACFQVHLWVGLAIGLYIVMLSLTGSALVFRREMVAAVMPAVVPFDQTAELLSPEALRGAAQRAYAGYEVTRVGDIQRRSAVSEISLRRGDEAIDRVFNAYTGEDLGDPFPAGVQWTLWLADLHDDLLLGRGLGRWWNGVGSILATVLCITGAFIWWPGVRNWRQGMTVQWRARWPRLTFDLHSAAGFWGFAMLGIWAVSGVYLCFPDPFVWVVDTVWGADTPYGARPGDIALEWLVRLHFGRWPSHALKVVWVVIGLVPALMFITGAAMWWNRVMRRGRASSSAVLPLAVEPRGVE